MLNFCGIELALHCQKLHSPFCPRNGQTRSCLCAASYLFHSAFRDLQSALGNPCLAVAFLDSPEPLDLCGLGAGGWRRRACLAGVSSSLAHDSSRRACPPKLKCRQGDRHVVNEMGSRKIERRGAVNRLDPTLNVLQE